MAKSKQQKTDGSANQFIIVCNRPYLQFIVPSKEWTKLQAEEQDGTLFQRNPRLNNPNAGTFMTGKMLGDMTRKFDGYGEYKTKDEAEAKIAFAAAKHCDPRTRLHSTSLPLNLEEESDEAA